MKVTTGYPIFITNDKDTKKDVKQAIEKAADDFYEAEGAIDTPPTTADDDFYEARGRFKRNARKAAGYVPVVAAYNYGKKRFGADGTTSDGDDFYEAEGVIESALVEDEFFDADGEDHSEFLDDFSNGNGYFSKEARAARQAARQEKRDKKGAASTDGTTPAEKKKFDLDKTLGQAKQGAELLGTVKGMFGKGGAPTGAPEVVGGGGYTPPADEKGMSTGAKIGIAVGAVALVGIIIYVATRKKGAKAGK